MNKLSQVDINNVINLYQNTNMELLEISKTIGYKSKDIIYKILNDNNIPKRRSIKYKIPLEQELTIVNMYTRENMTEKEIGKCFNVSASTISKILTNQRQKSPTSISG